MQRINVEIQRTYFLSCIAIEFQVQKSKSYLRCASNVVRCANSMQLRYRVTYGACHGAGYRKMISYPGVRIMEMVPGPAARPLMDKFICTSPQRASMPDADTAG